MLDEIAVQGELADERIDLAEREGQRRLPLQVAAQEAVRHHTEFERGAGGILDDGWAVFLRQGKDAEDAADGDGPVVLMQVVAERADGRSRGVRGRQERERFRRCARGPIDIGNCLNVLPEDGTVPMMPGWRAVFTPGHTAGHVSFYRETDKTLIAGDAVTMAIAVWIVYESRKLKASNRLIARMAGNVAIDVLIGAVPIIGSIFDIFFRANDYNLKLLLGHIEAELENERRRDADHSPPA